MATWLHSWEDNGICGLLDAPRSGRPRILNGEIERVVLISVDRSPRSLKNVLAEIIEKFSITPSIATLKRICKRANLSWKRVRKSLRSKRDKDLFEISKIQLAELSEQDNRGEIDLFYFDTRTGH